jgi:hypothetical protein
MVRRNKLMLSYTKVASISTCRRPKCQRIAGSSAVSHVYPGGKKFAKVDDFDNLISSYLPARYTWISFATVKWIW